jgi:hypothetical protein
MFVVHWVGLLWQTTQVESRKSKQCDSLKACGSNSRKRLEFSSGKELSCIASKSTE